jgi:hypothetical protein
MTERTVLTEALAAADEIIAEHGLPWTLNENGQLENVDEKARHMLALAYAKGLRDGGEATTRLYSPLMEQLDRMLGL